MISIDTIPVHSFISESNELIRLLPLERKQDYDTQVHHCHDYFELFLLHEDGEGVHEIDFVEYRIPKYSIQFLNPKQVHRMTRSSNTSKGNVILFNLDFLLGDNQLSAFYKQFMFFRGINKNPVLELDEATYLSFNETVGKMYKELSSPNQFTQNVVSCYLYVILVKCLVLKEGNEKTIASHSFILNRFIDFLDENFTTVKQVGEYAKMLNIGTKKLGRLCKEKMDLTPNEIIRQRILVEVKRMLLYTEKVDQGNCV